MHCLKGGRLSLQYLSTHSSRLQASLVLINGIICSKYCKLNIISLASMTATVIPHSKQWSLTVWPWAHRLPRKDFWVPARTFYKFDNKQYFPFI
jgi:hypothetical protein